jgi:hypothetical protein
MRRSLAAGGRFSLRPPPLLSLLLFEQAVETNLLFWRTLPSVALVGSRPLPLSRKTPQSESAVQPSGPYRQDQPQHLTDRCLIHGGRGVGFGDLRGDHRAHGHEKMMGKYSSEAQAKAAMATMKECKQGLASSLNIQPTLPDPSDLYRTAFPEAASGRASWGRFILLNQGVLTSASKQRAAG